MENIETEIEKCPLIGYCIDGVRLSDEKVCKGLEGDFRDCGAYEHYAEEDYKYHNPFIGRN